jgi:hypothetical protein
MSSLYHISPNPKDNVQKVCSYILFSTPDAPSDFKAAGSNENGNNDHPDDNDDNMDDDDDDDGNDDDDF